jgi:hypothetical protein
MAEVHIEEHSEGRSLRKVMGSGLAFYLLRPRNQTTDAGDREAEFRINHKMLNLTR